MRVLAFVLILLGVTLLACGGGGGGKATPASTKASTAGRTPAAARTTTAVASQPAATASQSGRRTGIAEVDAVIDAALAADAERLRPLIAFQRMPCNATPSRHVALPCETGEAPGETSDVLPTQACTQFVAVRARDLAQNVDFWFRETPTQLYGVYRSGGDVLVVFSQVVGQSEDQPKGLMVIMEGGRISRLDLPCVLTPANMVELAQPEETILPQQ